MLVISHKLAQQVGMLDYGFHPVQLANVFQLKV
jgi:hypothetical protein